MENLLAFLMTKKGVLTLCASVSGVAFGSYQFIDYMHKQEIYNSLAIQFSETGEIEYGTTNFDLNTLVVEHEGEVRLPQIDTGRVGEQTLVFTVFKEDQTKEFTKTVKITDTKAPQIEITQDTLSLEYGAEFDPQSVVSEVKDPVDGALNYAAPHEVEENIKALEEGKALNNYYTITSNVDTANAGDYEIHVKAVDQHGNQAEKRIAVNVKEKPMARQVNTAAISHPAPSQSKSVSEALQIALSLVGSPYRAGGATPAGFDCSGFTSYVFGQVGISIGRSAGAQASNGTGVSMADIQPGDLVIFNGGSHVAIYVGNGQIVHATNPVQGVRVDGMSGYGTITAIRRL